MTPEDKELLLKDLCARQPYGVKISVDDDYDLFIPRLKYIDGYVCHFHECAWTRYVDEIKPYLRTISSMTKEEFYELCELDVSLPPFEDYYGQMQYYGSGGEWAIVDVEIEDINKYMNYLNSHHFDYRGLIRKGLALEAPEGMYKSNIERSVRNEST